MTTFSEAGRHNMALLGREAGPYQEGFGDFLQAKALARKRLERFGNPTGANATVLALSDKKELVRNLCVRVDALRLAEIEALTNVLGCNKQEFVLELLVAGIEQAKKVLDQQGIRHLFDQQLDQLVEEAGFTMEQAEPEGFYRTHYKGQPVINARHQQHMEAASALTGVIEREITDGD